MDIMTYTELLAWLVSATPTPTLASPIHLPNARAPLNLFLAKIPAPSATLIYGAEQRPKEHAPKLSCLAVVQDTRIYTNSKYIPVGASGDIAVLPLADAKKALDEGARDIFNSWYNKLDTDYIFTFTDHAEARKLARKELIDKKPKDITVGYEPTDLVPAENVIDVLAGHISLEEAVLSRLESTRYRSQ